MQGEEDNWMPLESNPEVINPFINKMGLKTNEFSFQEMMSIEEWALQMLPSPVLGIMLCYEMSPAQLAFKNEQADGLNPEAVPKDIFYMKQFAHNACGTIALFHIILNNMGKHPGMVTADSYIEKFKNSGIDKDPKQRGEIFKSSNEIKSEHKGASQEGQSHVQSSVDSHFISFVQKDNVLWELDGMKKCPVNHGPCTEDELVTKGCAIIKQFMERDPENMNFSMLVLAKTPQE